MVITTIAVLVCLILIATLSHLPGGTASSLNQGVAPVRKNVQSWKAFQIDCLKFMQTQFQIHLIEADFPSTADVIELDGSGYKIDLAYNLNLGRALLIIKKLDANGRLICAEIYRKQTTMPFRLVERISRKAYIDRLVAWGFSCDDIASCYNGTCDASTERFILTGNAYWFVVFYESEEFYDLIGISDYIVSTVTKAKYN